MPTHFRWLWYLVGLAGMALMVLGIIGILGSAADLGIVIPLVVVVAIGIGYALIRFNRSLDAALAAAPSRQPGASGSGRRAGTRPGLLRLPTAGRPTARPVDDPAAGPSAPLPTDEAPTTRPRNHPAARPGPAAADVRRRGRRVAADAQSRIRSAPAVDVEAVAAEEADQGLAEALGGLDRQVRRRGHGAHDRDARRRPPSGRSRGSPGR